MKLWDLYIRTVIIEAVAVLIIILSFVTVKYCFKATFVKLKEWYGQNVMIDTDINEVLKNEA